MLAWRIARRRRRSGRPDLRRILGIQAVRALLYGFGAVILGSSLAANGASNLQVGILGAAILAGMAIAAIGVGLAGDRLGRRRAYTGLLALMGIVGLAYALTDRLWILVVLALLGVMSTDANENGPLTTLEQSMIGQAPAGHAAARLRPVQRRRLPRGRARRAARGRARPSSSASGPRPRRARRGSCVFPIGAAVCLWLAGGLSPELELHAAATSAPLERSRATVTKLASLFAVDAFAGGFVITVFIVYWFSTQLGSEQGDDVARCSSWPGCCRRAPRCSPPAGRACRPAQHDGLHPPAVEHPADADPAGAEPGHRDRILLLLRFALSQMDVPTRQAYIAAMVDPQERTAAAAMTNSARYVARPFGPLVGTLLMNNVAIGAPWVAAGASEVGLRRRALARVLVGAVARRDRLSLRSIRSPSTTSGAGSSTRSIRTMQPTSSSTHSRIVVAPRSPRTSATTHGRPTLLAAGHLAVGVAQPHEPLRLDRGGDPGLAHQPGSGLGDPERAVAVVAHLQAGRGRSRTR